MGPIWLLILLGHLYLSGVVWSGCNNTTLKNLVKCYWTMTQNLLTVLVSLVNIFEGPIMIIQDKRESSLIMDIGEVCFLEGTAI